MIRIAVIGDIGSGKSYVAKLMSRQVFNADEEVAYLYRKNKDCYYKLKKKLPNYITSFPIKKMDISKAILSNTNNLKKITKIVHPKIRFQMNKFIKKNKKKGFIVLDIPFFLENKMNKKKDVLIFIKAPKNKINKYLKKRLNYNSKITKNFKKLQLPLEFKRKKSNYIIENNFNNSVKKNVKKVIKKILINDRSNY